MDEMQKDENVQIKTKKPTTRVNIWAMVTLGILGVLAITIILMSIIPKSYAIELPKNSPVYFQIFKESTSNQTTIYNDQNKKLYDKVWEEFEDSFKQPALSALFQKELSNKIDYQYVSNKSLSNLISENDYIFTLVYADKQKLKKNGKAYVCDELKSNSQYTDGVVEFKKLWVTVNNVEGVSEVSFFVQRLASQGSSESNYAILKITTKGLQSQFVHVLEDAIAEIKA